MGYGILLLVVVLLLVTPWLPGRVRPIHFLQNFFIKFLHVWKVRPLDQDVCRDNLFAFDDAMRSLGLTFWLSEGTALGCVRDGAIIPWDDDVDVGMSCHDLKKFTREGVPKLIEEGFTLSLVYNGGTFFGFLRNGEKLDVDFACEGKRCQACRTSHAMCDTCDSVVHYTQTTRPVNFLGRDFLVPGDNYFEYLYGPHWKTPDRKKDLVL